MRPATALLLAASLLAAAVGISGCTTSASSYDPNTPVKETGKTVHLNISVVDLYDTEVYPGFNANLWAFCVTPVNPDDAYSAAAIHYYDPLPTDAPNLREENPDLWGKCSVPAPTIEVHQGDRVVVEFSHSHFHAHTIHWHGQYVPAEMDGAPGVSQTAVPSGGSITYDFIAKRAGTLWYHCHVDAGFHVMMGLYGMFIVDPQDTSHEPKSDVQATMVFSTMVRSLTEAVGIPHAHKGCGYVSGLPDCQNPPADIGHPDVFLINGHSYPLTMQQNQSVLHVKEGQTLRIRMLNAGETVEAIHLHGHDMEVVAEDGVILAQPYWVDTLTIAPAERFDVLVKANNPGVWMFHTHVDSHITNDEQSPGGMMTMLVYDGYENQCADCHAEAPGGFPYEPPVYMPGDVSNATAMSFGAGVAPGVVPGAPGAVPANARWTFPVELPCAIQTVRLDAQMVGGSAAGLSLSALAVTIRDPNGTVVGQFGLGRDSSNPASGAPYGSWASNGTSPGVATPVFLKGTYTVDVNGTAVQTSVHLHVAIDYFDSFEEMKQLHQAEPGKYPLLCGKYGYGNNAIPRGTPPD